MRSLFRFLSVALLLLIVALLSALISMRFAVHGREVTVPNMLGKSPPEARRLADEAGLAMQVEREYYSAKIPEGRVLSQMPPAGTVVRRGWELRLALSLGPQRVTIPQVVGQSDRAAAITIAQRGLELGPTATMALPGTVSGEVAGQDPPASATDVSAPKVNLLVVQDGPAQTFVMPSLIGRPLGSVTFELKDAGFSVGRVTMAQPAPVSAAGSETQQSHVGEISGPPGSAPAPSAEGQSSSPAAASATPPSDTSSQPAPSAASIVVSQDPAPGQKVPAGTSINFVVR